MLTSKLAHWFARRKHGNAADARLQTDALPVDPQAASVPERSFSIPVLCYHSWAMSGDAYEGNDHVALESDLKTLGRRGYQILPIPTLVALLRGEIDARPFTGSKLVSLSCDDARDFDYYPTVNDTMDPVPGFHEILERSRQWCDQTCAGPRAVSFVIASPEARRILDHTCGRGRDEWRDSWWLECAEKGTLGIANHGWDHVHDTLPAVRQRENKKGSFFEIDTFGDAEGQIVDAQRYIDGCTGSRSLPLFGYPYGHVPAYLRDEYFPNEAARIGIRAAFGTGGASVRPDTCIWDIPRFVCGWHWKGADGFEDLLDAIERGER